MATQYSNKPIVLDGLVYALDFGNQKSYVSGSSVARSLTFTTTSGSFTGNLASASLQGGLLNFNTNPGALGNDAGTKIEFSSLSNFTSLVYGGEFTLSFVVRTSTSTLNQTIFMGDPASGGVGASRVGFTVENGFYNFGLNYTPSINALGRRYPAPNNTLEYRTIRYKSGSWDHFVNGLPITASSVGVYSNPSFTIPLVISGRGPLFGNMFTGSLGLMHLYNRSLTSDEIWNNYQLAAPRYGLGPLQNKPYSLDENAYLFLQSAGITDPIITSSIDTFVRGLKSASLWDKMIAIYPFVGTGSVGVNLTGSHRWNLKEPSLVTYPLTFTGSWNGSTSGSLPSGSNTNISAVGITPSIVYPNYLTSSVHISILSYDTPVSRSYLMGTGMTEDLAASTLAGDYGTPAAAYSVRKVRTAYTGALMDVRRSIDNVTSSIGFVSNGDLDTGSLVNFVKAVGENSPGNFSGLAAAYSLRKVSASYSGNAIDVRRSYDNTTGSIGFDASGNLDTGSLLDWTIPGRSTLPGAYSGLAAAYSLRRVSSSYTGFAIDVRRDSDNTTSSIGFNAAGNLDTGALLAFVTGSANTGSGFVAQWYDQSGNNRHATQTTASSQPLIVSSGSLVTENGKPVVQFNPRTYVITGLNTNNMPLPHSLIMPVRLNNLSPNAFNSSSFYVGGDNNTNLGKYELTQVNTSISSQYRVNSGFSASAYAPSNTSSMYLHTGIFTTSSVTTFVNSQTSESVGPLAQDNYSGGNSKLFIGGYSTTTNVFTFKTGEFLVYTGSLSDSRPLIENNINTYYSIYTGSNNGFVTQWYDQSGNNRHATQTATGSQPLIVSSGSLIVNNGKPSVRFINTSKTFLTSPSFSSTNPIHNFLYFNAISSANFVFDGLATNQFRLFIDSSVSMSIYANGGTEPYYSDGTGILNKNYLMSILANGANTRWVINGGNLITASWGTTTTTGITLGRAGNLDSYYYNGYLSEFISYNSDQSSNRPLIENNINNYYNIYTGSNHGFVARWYDQSGNNRHASQTATGSQPLIVESGSVITTNNKPSLNFNTGKSLSSTAGTFSQPNTFYVVESASAAVRISISSTNLSSRNQVYQELTAGSEFRMFAGTDLTGSSITYGHRLATSIFNTSNSTGFQNGILRTSGNTGNYNQSGILIGDSTFGYGSGTYQEVIHYNSNQSTTREGIEYGINSYYNIYPQTSSFATSSFTIKADSGSISGSLNNRLTSGIAASGPLGLITVSRTGSNSLTIARNGVTSSFAVPASGALSTGLYLGAINNNGIAVGNSPVNIEYASVGTGLTNTEIGNYTPLVYNFRNNFRGYDRDAVNFINALGTARSYLTPTEQSAINVLVSDLKSANIWNKFQVIYPFIGGTRVSHGFNLKNPSTNISAYYMTFENTVLHSNLGITTNGGWGNTNFTPSLHPSNINSGHLSLYNRTSDTSDGYDFGVRANPGIAIMLRVLNAQGSINNSVGSGDTTSLAVTTNQGFYVASRINTLQSITQYRTTGTISGSLTNSPTGLPTLPLFIGTTNGNDFYKTSRNYAFASIGDGLTDTEAANLYTAVQKFQTTLGRQV